jgi:hypothetical protein
MLGEILQKDYLATKGKAREWKDWKIYLIQRILVTGAFIVGFTLCAIFYDFEIYKSYKDRVKDSNVSICAKYKDCTGIRATRQGLRYFWVITNNYNYYRIGLGNGVIKYCGNYWHKECTEMYTD